MISRAKIDAASSTLTETAITSLVSIVRMTARYKENPAYFSDLATRLGAVNGSLKAKQLNAVLDELETLGVGEVEINQAQTVGTDGLVYSQIAEREGLIDYALGVLYEAFAPSVYVDSEDTDMVLRGNYGVGRLPLKYEGYL